MIDIFDFIERESNMRMSSEERYIVLDHSLQSADDEGFVNDFIFKRAVFCYAAAVLLEDRREEIASMIAVNPMMAWDALVKDGTMKKLAEDYKQDFEAMFDEYEIIKEAYEGYCNSVRGTFNTFQLFSGDITAKAAEQLAVLKENRGDLEKAVNAAKKWGMPQTDNNVISLLER